MNPEDLFWFGPIPGAVALGVLLLATIFIAKPADEPTPSAAHRMAWVLAALAVGLAYLPAEYWINKFPGWWPKDATYRFGHIAIVATLLLMLVALFRSRLLIAGLAAILAPAAVWTVLETIHPRHISTFSLIAHSILAALLAAAAVLAPTRNSHARYTTPAALLPPALCAGPVLFLAHNASLAQQTGPLVAALSAWLIVALLRRPRALPEVVIAPYVIMLLAMLFAGHHHSYYPVHFAATVLLALALLSPGTARIPLKHPKLRAALPIILSLTLSAAALIVAALTKVTVEPYGY